LYDAKDLELEVEDENEPEAKQSKTDELSEQVEEKPKPKRIFGL
jgi:hypothetical protein